MARKKRTGKRVSGDPRKNAKDLSYKGVITTDYPTSWDKYQIGLADSIKKGDVAVIRTNTQFDYYIGPEGDIRAWDKRTSAPGCGEEEFFEAFKVLYSEVKEFLDEQKKPFWKGFPADVIYNQMQYAKELEVEITNAVNGGDLFGLGEDYCAVAYSPRKAS